MIPVHIISLAGPHPRRAFQESQFADLGLTPQFLDAATPDNITPEKMRHLTTAWARPLRPTEIALTESHRLLWEEAVRRDGPVLVLEDDVVLSRDLPQVLEAVENRHGMALLQFETFTVPKLMSRARDPLGVGNYALARLHRDKGGSAAYVIWPAGARRLLASLETAYPPSDAALNHAPGLRSHQLVPAPAIQAMHVPKDSALYPRIAPLAPSVVGRTSPPPVTSRADWMRYKARRLGISLRMSLRGLRRGLRREMIDFAGDLT